jgi:hypothetical protein
VPPAHRNDLKDLGRIFHELVYVGGQQMHNQDSTDALGIAAERQHRRDGDSAAIERDDGTAVPTRTSAFARASLCLAFGPSESTYFPSPKDMSQSEKSRLLLHRDLSTVMTRKVLARRSFIPTMCTF